MIPFPGAGAFKLPQLRLVVVLILLSVVQLGAVPTPYHLEEASSQSLAVTCQISAASHTQGSPARWLLPELPTRETQDVDDLDLNVPTEVISDVSNPPKSLRSAWIHGQALGDSYFRRYLAALTLHVRIHQRRLLPGSGPAVPPLAHATEERFLVATPTLNWSDERFLQWLAKSGLHRGLGESQLEYARRLYDHLLRHSRYVYPPSSGWEAAATCCHLRTDCGGLSGVFVAACRANHIPARLLIGQWFRLKTMGDRKPGTQPHVYAEFFMPEVGWVPVDLASALLYGSGPDAGSEYFGVDPPYFLVLTYETDFRLPTPSDGLQKVQWMQSPSLWFRHDLGAAPSVNKHWTYVPIADKPSAIH